MLGQQLPSSLRPPPTVDCRSCSNVRSGPARPRLKSGGKKERKKEMKLGSRRKEEKVGGGAER